MPFLVAIDLSAPSRHAIEVAALLARATGLEPLLLHVAERDPTLRQLADLYDLAEPLRALGSSPSLRTIEGEPATCICEQATARGCAFVVMGTHGRQGTASERPGSVARSVMAHALVPVIAVRPGTASAERGLCPVPRTVPAERPHPTSPTAARVAALLKETLQDQRVVPVDASHATPPWLEQVLQRDPLPVVLVSSPPDGGGVSDATPLG